MILLMAMETIDHSLQQRVKRLVDIYRTQCLWFLRADYYPATRAEMLRTLDYIRRYGDREAFCEAGSLYQWLSHNSSKPSATS